MIFILAEEEKALNPILLNFESILYELSTLNEEIENLKCESIYLDLMSIQINDEEIEEFNNSKITDFFTGRNLFPDVLAKF